ncbi:hypothetical protein M9H77_36506 [Catharanthus roseus]|uniref:Uncharacterized protein n=1 Tax=Catharanthus roseus TaxID=4058 RepID=A0ACB9ZUK8_CATRO|nr:hypothetical protein M9H77_36506 [Catharanthus roseus]
MSNLYIVRSELYPSYQKPSRWQIFEHTMRTCKYSLQLSTSRSLTSLHLYMPGVDMFVPVWNRRYRRTSTACSTTRLSASAPLNSTSTPVQYVPSGIVTRRLNKERLLDIVL